MSYRANNKPFSGNRYTYHLPAMNAEEMVDDGWTDDYDRYTRDADSAVDEFFERELSGYEGASVDEQYRLLRLATAGRRSQMLERQAMYGAESSEAYIRAFNHWEHLREQTTSHYTRRLIDWAKNREIHEIIKGVPLEVDRAASDPVAYAEWADRGFYDLPPKGVVQRINYDQLDVPPAVIEENVDVFRYAEKLLAENPQLGDIDYNAPSPYAEMDGIDNRDDIPYLERELALETAKLFRVDINQISNSVRSRLYHFGVNLDDMHYERVDTVAQALDTDSRAQFAEAFLATEFGDDFGEVLLSAAEHGNQKDFVEILANIERIRGEAKEFAGNFADFDQDLAGEIEHAVGERVTEMLYVFEEMSTDENSVATARVLGNRITKDDPQQVINALHLTGTALAEINQALGSGEAKNVYAKKSTAWQLGEEKNVLLQLKQYGSQKGEHARGIEHSEEAQVNFSVDVSDKPQSVPIEIAEYRRRYALSIRLDLEGMIRDVNGGRAGFDATREQLNAALDLGSLKAQTDNPNYVVGSVVALGNKLRKRKLSQGRSAGYHTSLSQKYGDKQVFAALTDYMKQKITRPHEAARADRSARVVALGRTAHRQSALPSGKAAA